MSLPADRRRKRFGGSTEGDFGEWASLYYTSFGDTASASGSAFEKTRSGSLRPLFLAAQPEQAIAESTPTRTAENGQRTEYAKCSSKVGMAADQNTGQPERQPKHDPQCTIEPSKIEDHRRSAMTSATSRYRSRATIAKPAVCSALPVAVDHEYHLSR